MMVSSRLSTMHPGIHPRTHAHTYRGTHPLRNKTLKRRRSPTGRETSPNNISQSVMTTICEGITLIRVDVAQGIQGRVDVYMNICVGECPFVFNTNCCTMRCTHTQTHTHMGEGSCGGSKDRGKKYGKEQHAGKKNQYPD